MSNEALQHERVPVSLAIKAADATFSQDHRTYTTILTDVSHRGLAEGTSTGGNKKRHDSHQNKKQKGGDHKKEESKGGRKHKDSHRNRNRRSTSGENEMASLRNEIAELHEENASIRKELEDLRNLVQKSTPPDWVLILGDGNLSYSHAFALAYPNARITATVLEPDSKTFASRYKSGVKFAQELQQMAPRVRLKFGVDATKLSKDFVYNFRLIIMNFPHPGGKNNMKHNRELLSRIYRSVSEVLRQRTEFRLTLRASQIGLNLGDDLKSAISSQPPDHKSDSWRAVYLAADNQLFLDCLNEFQELDGYSSSGYKNQDRFFHNDTALTMSFRKFPASTIPHYLEDAKRLESHKRHSQFCRIHPIYVRDISILFRNQDFKQEDEDFMYNYVKKLTGSLVIRIEERSELRCEFNGRHNRMYKLYWQSCTFPLSRKLCNELNDELIENLALTNQLILLTVNDTSVTCQKKTEAAPAAKKEEAGGDEDFDLFDSDEEEETEEQKKIREGRLAAYAAKKAKKPGPIAKSSVILDVKPWDDETSLDEMEKLVKSIEMDGLLWGATKKVPIGYGISKLQIVCTVEDEKVSVDDLQEKIAEFEDHVQSVDIVAFNKI